MAIQFINGKFHGFNDDGTPMVGGLLYTYVSGTTTPQATYTDSTLGTPNTNPVVLDSRGEASVWLGTSAYTMKLTTSVGALVWTEDGVIDSSGSFSAALASAANGSGADLVGGVGRVVTSITALRALLKTGVGKAFVLGYYASGDGGGGQYYYDASDTTSADNGGTIIVASDGGRWKLAHVVTVSVKQFGAKMDGATDDTAVLNAAATWARSSGNAIYFPESLNPSLVSATLDFSGIAVYAHGRNLPHIKATSAQFDVIKTTGDTLIVGLYVHGGWDGVTAGQSGDILSIKATSPAYPYRVHLRDCVFQYAKQRHIYWERGGYSSAFNIKCNAAGLHSIELFGNSAVDACTTVVIGGESIFSDCPNGYAAKLTECILVGFDGAIMENTKGIQLNGADNRSLSFRNVYQENTAGGLFIDPGTSSGGGLTVQQCYGGGASIPYPTNWQDVYFQGNSLLTEPAIPLANRIISNNPAGTTTSTVGGVDLTLATLSVPPGTWNIYFAAQTLNSAGATFVKAGARLTTTVTDSGLASGVNPMVFPADEANYTPSGGSADVRLKGVWAGFQNTGTVAQNVYLRGYVNISAGTIAIQGAIYADKVQ